MTSADMQATADTLNPTHERSAASDPAAGITEQKAITIAQQQFKGRVLAVNQIDHTYRVKILSSQGTVHTVLIDVHDGSVISAH
ncbi:PepSY domain-containing protein [Nitrosomonas sp.]|uniref:PepSY domain-containing protein n=1 Tax=Nitrosomonas sp. TaxID=42353 RepID=UPI0025F46825|nr:PepSY domain-containing protein [Nitrosomonas sp.]